MTKKKTETDLSTEEKIKEAARKVFTQKGFAATRTRDIAEEAGINLALLNYYFRSKEKLFELVMLEKVEQFFGIIAPVLTDSDTTLEIKIELIVNNYIDMLINNQDLPLFIISEIRNHPERFNHSMHIGEVILKSVFVLQLKEYRPDLNPLHFFTTLIGMIVFPFIARPIMEITGSTTKETFATLMKQRRQLIPKWTKAILEVT